MLTENDKIENAFKDTFQSLLNQPYRNVNMEKYDTVEQSVKQLSLEEEKTGPEMLKDEKFLKQMV